MLQQQIEQQIEQISGIIRRVRRDSLAVEHYFKVDIGDGDPAFFRAVSGGQMSITLIEHNVVYSGGGSSTLFIPGPTSFEPITLQYGVSSDDSLWTWWTQITQGKSVRRNLTITAYAPNNQGEEDDTVIAQWDLTNAWPLSISGFSFDVDSDKAYIGSTTIVAEFIERTD